MNSKGFPKIIFLSICLLFTVFAASAEAKEKNLATASEEVSKIVLTIGSNHALVNNQEVVIESAPYINPEVNRALVPVRFVSEQLGAEVDWLEDRRQIRIVKDKKEITLTLDSNQVTVDGKKSRLDCPAEIKNDRIFVPLRFISEAMGANCEWDRINRKFTITLLSTPVSDLQYFVAPYGSDSNPGTFSLPFRTIQKAANVVKPGYTVYIREGTYTEKIVLQNSGTLNAPITFCNFEGESVIIDGQSIDWEYDWLCLFSINNKKYINVIGINLINSRWFGFGSNPYAGDGCKHILIKNCSTYNTRGSGIIFIGDEDIRIEGCTVELACNDKVGATGPQECITFGEVIGGSIMDCHIFNCTNEGVGGEGLDIKNGCSGIVVARNWIHDIKKVGIYIDAWSKYQDDIQVYDNIIYNCEGGIWVATERGGLLENVRIFRNVSYYNHCGFGTQKWGMASNHEIKDIYFYNNTAYGNSECDMNLNNNEAVNVVIANNIFGGPYSSINNQSANMEEYRIESNFLANPFNGHPKGTNYITGYPLFVDPSNGDFRLQPGSAAIGAGKNIWTGEAVNMGAF